MKKESSKPIYRNFSVPEIGFYKDRVKAMNAAYDGFCPVCLHEGLIFGSDSGIWQASKDKMRPGLPYGHPDQIMRWCCTCCNK